MIVDLHAHYPMHVIPEVEANADEAVRRWEERERCKAKVVKRLSKERNFEGPNGQPGITVESLKAGDVGIALSVLFCPLDELWPRGRDKPPKSLWFDNLLNQLETVEKDVNARAGVSMARSLTAAQQANARGDVALIHCVEGGFALGANEQEIAENVRELRERGVAYVTLAHLFFRGIARNAPALPFLPDRVYKFLFRQPRGGLTKLGVAALESMVRQRILIDVAHMDAAALAQTFKELKRIDPDCEVPVIATHGACRMRGNRLAYNFNKKTIRAIAERDGVIGLIACAHYMKTGRREPKTREESFEAICRHVECIRKATGSLDNVAIGSDIDGYIKPALRGLGDASGMRWLQDKLAEKYDPADVAKICHGNAERVLKYWAP